MFFIINGLPHAIRLRRLKPQLALRLFGGENQKQLPSLTHLLPAMFLGGVQYNVTV